MAKQRRLNGIKCLAIAGLIILLSQLPARASELIEVETESDLRLLINTQYLPEDLNLGSLRAIFSLRKRSWPDGSPITVLVLGDQHPVHQKFCKTVLKIYPFVLREQWDRLLFSGIGTPPTVVKDLAQLRELVRQTPGAIGYTVNTDSADAKASSEEFSE